MEVTKETMKQELRQTAIQFFSTTNRDEAINIIEHFYKELLSCPFSANIALKVHEAIKVWKGDVGNYLTTMDENNKFDFKMAHLAIHGMITFVDLSDLPY